jgi:arginyl-tRNA synthetase
MAYHFQKSESADALIDIWGADHAGTVKRIRAAVSALTGGKPFDVKLIQMVRLLRAGEPVKMSKRSGDFVTLRDVVDEVGRDAVRFMMLFRKNDAPLEFDLAKVIEQSKDNPVFYVQYAHARGRSVLRQALAAYHDLDLSTDSLGEAALDLLDLRWPTDSLSLKARYKELAKRYHPDSNGGDRSAEDRLKDINRAYSLLRHKLAGVQASAR